MLFDWDEANLSHIARHDLTQHDVEAALLGYTLDVDSYVVGGERRFEQIGQTSTGRILIVVTTEREQRLRVVTAFNASRHTRLRFIEHWRKLHGS